MSPARKPPALHVVITAGPTREYIDPVRYLSNESSGRSKNRTVVRAAPTPRGPGKVPGTPFMSQLRGREHVRGPKTGGVRPSRQSSRATLRDERGRVCSRKGCQWTHRPAILCALSQRSRRRPKWCIARQSKL